MKKTKFLFFKKPDTTDIVGPEDFNDNSDKIDEMLYNSARIEEAGGTANAITLKSVTLENGAIKNFIATSNNNSAATTINGKNVYRAGTTEPPTFMEKKAYCIWYNSIGDNFFTKANAEGDVDASEVLAGKYFSNDKDTHIKGTMPNNPSINAALNCSDSITIPKGYTPGGVVKANSLASQTSATAEDNKVLKGYTYWKDGVRRTGNIELLQTQTITPGTSNKIIAPGKYINGNQIIKGDANLVPDNIVRNKSIFGVTGNAFSKADIKNGNVILRYRVAKLSEQALNLNGTSNNMYEVLQKYRYYVSNSGDKVCDVFYIDNNLNNLIFCKSSGTASTSQNKDDYDYLQYVDLATFKTTSNTMTYLPLDQVGEGKKYQSIPKTGTTKYGTLVVNESRSNSSNGNSWCDTSTIRLQTSATTYDLLTLNHYGWLFGYSSNSDRFITIVNKRENSKNYQYKTEFQIIPEIVDRNGNVIG